jgi:hypothetical protein
VIGAGGIERIVDINLTKDEQAMFDKSVAAVKGLVDACKKIAAGARLTKVGPGEHRPQLFWYVVYRSLYATCIRRRSSDATGETSMNIHEYQAKAVLKEYGAPVAEGVADLLRR